VVAVGDVSGKGIPAALFMAVTSTLIRMMARRLKTPDEIILQVNDALTAQNPRNMFVPLFCPVFDPAGGSVTHARAGHPSPVLLRPGQAPSLPAAPTAMVAGIAAGMDVQRGRVDLRRGDTLVFYTDGVTEAFNADGVQFGEQGLLQHLSRSPGTS